MEYIFENANLQPATSTAKEVVQLLYSKRSKIDEKMSQLSKCPFLSEGDL